MSLPTNTMTVRELRDLLANYHDNELVFVDGYEDGYTVPKVRETPISHQPTSGWWQGDWNDSEQSGVPSVVIGR